MISNYKDIPIVTTHVLIVIVKLAELQILGLMIYSNKLSVEFQGKVCVPIQLIKHLYRYTKGQYRVDQFLSNTTHFSFFIFGY